jgi:hypothetical protein
LSSSTDQNERKLAESQLRILQRGPDGWQLASAFLNSPYKEVRFYGPLTYTIKLNSGDNISFEEAAFLLEQLMAQFIHMVSRNESAFVVLKMCSTLALFFLKFPQVWPYCAKHCICSLAIERMISFKDLEHAAPTVEFLGRLDLLRYMYAIQFLAAIADEASKANPDNGAQ